MAIQVHADGRVTFRIPKQLPGTDVQKQLESHRGWILNKLLEMEDRRKKREKAKVQDGAQDQSISGMGSASNGREEAYTGKLPAAGRVLCRYDGSDFREHYHQKSEDALGEL